MPADHDSKTRIYSPGSLPGPRGECLIQIYGDSIGRRYPLVDLPMVIGRASDSNVAVESDTVSRYHAQLDRADSGRVRVSDLSSTNGTYVNNATISEAELVSGDMLRVGDTIFKFIGGDDVEVAYYDVIYNMAIQDGLTQIANRRCFDDFFGREFARAKRFGRPLSLIFFDIDFFKSVNDRFGHLTGDGVLRELAAIVRDRVRKEELFARYGGEEFAVVLPEAALSAAMRFAEAIRRIIEQHEFRCEDDSIRLSVSLGVAAVDGSMERPEDLLRRADDALYRAKAAGRNTVRK